MTNTRKIIETLLLAADDLPLATKMNVLYCLDHDCQPAVVVSGPLYLNATRAAKVMGIGRTSFYKAVDFHRIPAHEITEGNTMFFTQDLLVHQKEPRLDMPVPHASTGTMTDAASKVASASGHEDHSAA